MSRIENVPFKLTEGTFFVSVRLSIPNPFTLILISLESSTGFQFINA
jgi:hypothetical protein